MTASDRPTTDAGPRRPRVLPGRRRALRLVAALVALALVVLVGNATFVLLHGASRLNRHPGVAGHPAGVGEPVNILVFGTSSASMSSGLGEAAMLLHLPARGSDLYVISLPRNAVVAVPGVGPEPFATVLKDEATTRTVVEETLGLTINHVVTLDMAGLLGLTDALGGITVENPTEMTLHRQGLSWPAGEVHLTGDDVSWFVTLRADTSAAADADRATRQRRVMVALLGGLSDPAWLVNPVRGVAVMDAIAPAVTVDSSLTAGMLAQIGVTHPGLVRPRMHAASLPVGEDGTLDPVAAAELGRALADDAVAEYAQAHPESFG